MYHKCGYNLETISHVLNQCDIHVSMSIAANKIVSGAHGDALTFRPDIIVRDDDNCRVTIVKVCIRFENRREAF